MTQVDPFVHPIPAKLNNDPETGPFFRYFVKWAHDIWIRTGGSDDLVADEGTRETYPWVLESTPDATQSALATYAPPTESQVEIITKTVSRGTYTAVDNMFVYLQNGSKLFLPSQPKRNSVIYMTKDSSRVTVNGNGKPINGITQDICYTKPNLSRTYQYFIDSDEWRIR